MKLKSLKLENFRQHEDSLITFLDGITIISGANGSGKSTVLEAIAWSLYGVEATRGNKDSIRFNRAKPRTKVLAELTFSLDGTVYRVVRGLDKAEVYLSNDTAPVVTSQQEVTAYLTEKIGMTRNEFFNTYFTSQKELNFLKNQGPTERKKFISRVMGYDKMLDARDKARIDKNNLEKEITGIKLGLDNLEELEKEREQASLKLAQARETLAQQQKEFNETAETLAKIEPEWEKWRKTRECHEKLSWEIGSISEKTGFLLKNIQNLSERFEKLDTKRIRFSELDGIEQKYKDFEKKIQEQEDLQEKDAEKQKYLTKIEGLSREIKEKQDYIEEIIKSGKEKKVKIELIPSLGKEIEDLNRQIQQIEINLKEIQKTEKQLAIISEKGRDGACPTCERPLKEEYDRVINGFKSQIAELSKDKERLGSLKQHKQGKENEYKSLIVIEGLYNDEKNRYITVKNEIDARHKQIEQINKTLVEFPHGFDIEVLKRLRADITPIKRQYEEYLSLKAELSGHDRLKKEIEEAIKEKTEVEQRQKAIEEEIKSLNYSEKAYQEAENSYNKIRNDFHRLREELVRTESEEKSIARDIDRISKIEKSNKEKQALIKDKQEEYDLLSELDRFYIKLWEKLNEEIRPEIAELSGKFLSDLTDNRYSTLEINDKYEICLQDDGETKPVISGGEEDIVNLCIRLAISQIIAHRSGKSLSLLILDEIFGSLDENRRCNVISLLRNLLNNFEQVILITHIDDIKYEIDNVINIEFDPERGCSIISASNPLPASEIPELLHV